MPPPRRDRQEEDRELLKLVGAVLDHTTSKGGPPWWVKLRNRLLPRRLVVAVRRHRLYKLARKYRLALACVALSLIPLYALLVVTSSSTEAEEPLSLSAPLATAPPPELPAWRGEPVGALDAEATNRLGYWFGLAKDPDWKKRSEAAYELRKRSRESNVAATSLALLLNDAHSGPRFWTAVGLITRGLHLDEVKEAVRGFAGNDELYQMYQAGSPKMRDAYERVLKKWLREKDDLFRWTALTLCGKLELRGETFRPHLERIAEVDPQPAFRRQAEIVLRRL